MRLKTKEDLTNYILRKLGAPILRVELTKEQIQDNIDYAIKEFSQFAYDGDLDEVVILTVNGQGYYQMPDFITSVKGVYSTNGGVANYGSNYVPDRWSEQFFSSFPTGNLGIDSIIAISSTMSLFDKYVRRELHYTFNEYKNQIHITENYKGNVAIAYTFEYTPDEIDKIYNQQWVKDYATALCKFQLGINLGKYSAPLVGGSTVNYSDMKSEAENEIERLKEELFSKYAGPAPVDIA